MGGKDNSFLGEEVMGCIGVNEMSKGPRKSGRPKKRARTTARGGGGGSNGTSTYCVMKVGEGRGRRATTNNN